MTLHLPEPTLRHVTDSPLSLVVCQIRTEENLRLAEPQLALHLSDRLQDDYPRINRLSGARTQLVRLPSSLQVEPVELDRRRGHRLSSEADDWHVTLESDSFALETTAYTTWGDFLPRFQDLITAVAAEARPVFEARVGLRYVNIVRGTRLLGRKLERPVDFAEVMSAWVSGPLTIQGLAEASQDVDGRTMFDLGGNSALNARYGTVRSPDEELSFLLDFDAFREAGRTFDVGVITELLNEFNVVSTALFEASFNEKGIMALTKGD